MRALGATVADTWYANEIDGAIRLDDVLDRLPALLRWAVRRFGLLRGIALFLTGWRAAAVVTTITAPGAHTCVALCGLFGLRRLVLLEYIVHPPPRNTLRWAYFVLLRQMLLRRALLAAQVLSAEEAVRYPVLHRIPAQRFVLIRWPARTDDAPLPPLTCGPRVLASGRRTDWATFFAAVADARWEVRTVCTSVDLREVRRLSASLAVTIRHDIPADEHKAEVAAATVYVIPVPETGASIGQVRVMNAADAGVPIVASDVLGLRDYIDESCAVLVPPGDPAALRAAVDALLVDPDRREALRQKARQRRGTTADYLSQIRELVARVAAVHSTQ